MSSDVRITMTVARVLKAFLENPSLPRYGFELMRLTGLQSGSLYPILARLERSGWLEAEREDIDPAEEGRPPRKLYRISPDGMALARHELALLSEQFRPPHESTHPLRPQGGFA